MNSMKSFIFGEFEIITFPYHPAAIILPKIADNQYSVFVTY